MFAGEISEKEIIAIVGGILFLIVEIVGMSLSNKYYKQKYKLPLYGGGVVALLADIVIVFAGFCLYEGKMYGIALIILGVLMYGGVGFYNVKKCGKIDIGVRALLLQIVFALGSPFETIVFRRDRFGRYRNGQQQNEMQQNDEPQNNVLHDNPTRHWQDETPADESNAIDNENDEIDDIFNAYGDRYDDKGKDY